VLYVPIRDKVLSMHFGGIQGWVANEIALWDNHDVWSRDIKQYPIQKWNLTLQSSFNQPSSWLLHFNFSSKLFVVVLNWFFIFFSSGFT